MTAQVLHARPTYSLPEANVGTLRALISGGRKEGGGGGGGTSGMQTPTLFQALR